VDCLCTPISPFAPFDEALRLEIVEQPDNGRPIEPEGFREIFLTHWIAGSRNAKKR
jgi:hypothetical protein